MSRIYFHTIDGEAAVSGAERYHFGLYCGGLAYLAFEPILDDLPLPSLLRRAIPPTHYINSSPGISFRDGIRMMLRSSDETILETPAGRESAWYISINTALSVGSDAVRLGARLHAQCELHAWVDGENRAWLAGIIRDGREGGFYRADMGWEKVIELLESADDSPVVTSFSVCESFPNKQLDNEREVSEKDNPEYWWDLSADERWRRAIAGLRAESGWLELRPDNFSAVRFGKNGLNAYMVVASLIAATPAPQEPTP